MHVRLEFTPEVTAAYPALQGLLAGIENPQLAATAKFMAKGDLVRIQGVPVPTELQVFMRVWTVMNEESTLLLVLSPAPGEAGR